jgi:L-amino acid N-acyltransferase YncA
MYEKVGFLKGGVKKSATKKDTGYIDLVIMGILLPR